MAIFVALQLPEVEVIGLTTIYGNVYTTLATRNALHLVMLSIYISTYWIFIVYTPLKFLSFFHLIYHFLLSFGLENVCNLFWVEMEFFIFVS